jgi:hypothetical protein
MKKLTLALLLLPCLAMAQNKGDQKIIVTVTDTAKLFSRAANYLMDIGYNIQQQDEILGYINTDESEMKKWNASQKLRVRIQDSTMTITGQFALNGEMVFLGTKQSRTFSPAEYRGVKGSMYMTVWNEMLLMARYFGDKIRYSK